jgi:carbohydrate-selective porin OprB
MNLELNYLPRIIIQPSTGTNLAFHPGQKWGFVTKYQINKDPNDTKYIKFGLFDTNNYKVYEDDENGLSFDYTGPLAYALELGIHKPGPATSFAKVGAHWNEGSFPDLSSVSTGAKINNNYLFYFSLGRTLAQFGARDKTHLDGSIMWSYAPADRNLYNQQLTCALRLVGPFASRPKDEIGLGSIMSFLSNDYAKKNNLAMNEEYTVELSYKAKISPFFTIQPGIQAVFNPKGNNNRSDLYLATVRTVITF